MADNQNIRTIDEVTKEASLKHTLKELVVSWGKLIGIIIRTYTVGLPAKIRLWKYERYLKGRRQAVNKA